MKSIKLSLVVALLATTAAVSSASANDVEVSANMAMTSNYVWRGMTQTGNSPAIQGGVDASMGGFYAGLWGSSLEGGAASMEADIYLGYAGEVSKISYDIGFINYMYPNASDELNFGEAYLSLGYDFGALSVGASYAMGVSTADADDIPDNIEGSVSVPLPADITLDAVYGMYDTVGDYYSIGASKSLGKFDFTLAYTGISADSGSSDDQDNIVLTVGTSF